MYHHFLIVLLLITCLENVICLTKRRNRNIMSTFGELLSKLEPETKNVVRRIEQNQKKITNTHYAVVFDKRYIYICCAPSVVLNETRGRFSSVFHGFYKQTIFG